jgi:hypothetical protein
VTRHPDARLRWSLVPHHPAEALTTNELAADPGWPRSLGDLMTSTMAQALTGLVLNKFNRAHCVPALSIPPRML